MAVLLFDVLGTCVPKLEPRDIRERSRAFWGISISIVRMCEPEVARSAWVQRRGFRRGSTRYMNVNSHYTLVASGG